MTSARRTGEAEPVGTFVQRLRVRVIDRLSRLMIALPERPLVRLAEAVGLLHYAIDRERALLVRRNMQRITSSLAERGMGPERVRAAATDPRALEGLVRGAFRHHMRYYVELLRAPGIAPEDAAHRMTIENPEVLAQLRADLARGGVLGLALHFGAIELPAIFFAHESGRPTYAPMETNVDPALQAWLVRTRSNAGTIIVGLREAKRELSAALAVGSTVGMIGDRDITGGGIPTPFFGAPAPLPVGIGLFLLEAHVPVYVGSCRRAGSGHYRVTLIPLAIPTEGTRRQRVEAMLRNEVEAFEQVIAQAPEQWWATLFPIWADLDPAAERGAAEAARHTARDARRSRRAASGA